MPLEATQKIENEEHDHVTGAKKVTDVGTEVTSENMTYIITPVIAADEGTPGYVTGSAGQTKTMLIYPTGAAPAAAAKLKTFKYENVSYATFATSIIDTTSVVP